MGVWKKEQLCAAKFLSMTSTRTSAGWFPIYEHCACAHNQYFSVIHVVCSFGHSSSWMIFPHWIIALLFQCMHSIYIILCSTQWKWHVDKDFCLAHFTPISYIQHLILSGQINKWVFSMSYTCILTIIYETGHSSSYDEDFWLTRAETNDSGADSACVFIYGRVLQISVGISCYFWPSVKRLISSVIPCLYVKGKCQHVPFRLKCSKQMSVSRYLHPNDYLLCSFICLIRQNFKCYFIHYIKHYIIY